MRLYQPETVENVPQRSKRQRFPSKFTSSIKELLRESRRIPRNQKDDTSGSYQQEQQSQQNSFLKCTLPNGRKINILINVNEIKKVENKKIVPIETINQGKKSLLDIFNSALKSLNQIEPSIKKCQSISQQKFPEQKKQIKKDKGDQEKYQKIIQKYQQYKIKLEKLQSNIVWI